MFPPLGSSDQEFYSSGSAEHLSRVSTGLCLVFEGSTFWQVLVPPQQASRDLLGCRRLEPVRWQVESDRKGCLTHAHSVQPRRDTTGSGESSEVPGEEVSRVVRVLKTSPAALSEFGLDVFAVMPPLHHQSDLSNLPSWTPEGVDPVRIAFRTSQEGNGPIKSVEPQEVGFSKMRGFSYP